MANTGVFHRTNVVPVHQTHRWTDYGLGETSKERFSYKCHDYCEHFQMILSGFYFKHTDICKAICPSFLEGGIITSSSFTKRQYTVPRTPEVFSSRLMIRYPNGGCRELKCFHRSSTCSSSRKAYCIFYLEPGMLPFLG